MRHIAASATKRPTEHNADYVPGHIISKLDGGVVLKVPVGGIETDASIRLVAAVEVKQGHPDPIKTAEFSLQAAGIGRLANAWGFPADGVRNNRNRNIQFARDSARASSRPV